MIPIILSCLNLKKIHAQRNSAVIRGHRHSSFPVMDADFASNQRGCNEIKKAGIIKRRREVHGGKVKKLNKTVVQIKKELPAYLEVLF